MKRIATWVLIAAFVVFVIDWGVVGVKLLRGDDGITAGAWIGAVCWGVMMVCLVCRAVSSRCPHCGKMRATGGKFCPYCGKEI